MREIKFLLAVWKANLLSVMEYRVAFLTQVIGMMANNFIYFAIWIIFFDRFKDVRGWGVNDMYVTFGVLASSFGLVALLFGNAFVLRTISSTTAALIIIFPCRVLSCSMPYRAA